ALDPIEGGEIMSRRRHGRSVIASGPGRLGQAMRIDGSCDGTDLSGPPLTVAGGWPVVDASVGVSPRIGVTRADDWPLRFYVRGNTHVSGKPC
ncbi:MAG: DNA-3-methyladenine glycosylase, partial [Longimicrobiales bacterium]